MKIKKSKPNPLNDITYKKWLIDHTRFESKKLKPIRLINSDNQINYNIHKLENSFSIKPCCKKTESRQLLITDKKVHQILSDCLRNKKSFKNFVNLAGIDTNRKSLRSVNLKSVANDIEYGLIKRLEQDMEMNVKNYLKENLVGDISQDINMSNLFNKLNEFLEIEKSKIKNITKDIIFPLIKGHRARVVKS